MRRPRTRKCEDTREAEAYAELKHYCQRHPHSPTATRRPRIMVRGNTFIALLGSTLEDGIAGLGDTVEAALRAFDDRYSETLKRPRS